MMQCLHFLSAMGLTHTETSPSRMPQGCLFHLRNLYCQTSEGHAMEMEESGHALFDSLRTSNAEMPCWKTPVATWSLGNVWMLWGFDNTAFCSQRMSWKGLKGVGVAHYVHFWMLWGPSSSQRRARNEEIAQMRDLADIIGLAGIAKVIHRRF